MGKCDLTPIREADRFTMPMLVTGRGIADACILSPGDIGRLMATTDGDRTGDAERLFDFDLMFRTS
jgi:hypothetical protein